MVEIISVIHNSNEKVYMDYIDFKECSDIYIGVSEDIKDGMVKRGIQPENIYSMTCPFPYGVFTKKNGLGIKSHGNTRKR